MIKKCLDGVFGRHVELAEFSDSLREFLLELVESSLALLSAEW